jgi:hypothetical protein
MGAGNTGCQALIAHACDPSYPGGRDQGDHGSKPAQANGSQELILKTFNTKRAGGMVQGVGREFELQYSKNKNKKNGGRWRLGCEWCGACLVHSRAWI